MTEQSKDLVIEIRLNLPYS